jgi:hypothetical protein
MSRTKNVPTAPCARPVASTATRASVPQQHFEVVQAARGLARSQSLAIRYLLLPGIDESVALTDFYVPQEARAETEYAGNRRTEEVLMCYRPNSLNTVMRRLQRKTIYDSAAIQQRS